MSLTVFNPAFKPNRPPSCILVLISFKEELKRAFDFLTSSKDVFFNICDFSLQVAFHVLLKRFHLAEEGNFAWKQTYHAFWQVHRVQVPLQLLLVDFALFAENLEVLAKSCLLQSLLIKSFTTLFSRGFGSFQHHSARWSH